MSLQNTAVIALGPPNVSDTFVLETALGGVGLLNAMSPCALEKNSQHGQKHVFQVPSIIARAQKVPKEYLQ